MIEVPELRDYKRKVEVDETAVNKQAYVKLFPGNVHYFNKLQVGDGIAAMRNIDINLQWSEEKRGWYFLFHSYQPFIPEYCDQIFAYRDLYKHKDQVFAFKPRNVGHVAGRLVASVPGLTENNAVIYDDAFGPGMDLIIAFTLNKLRKIVRIRNGFKPTVDTDFDFFLTFPEGHSIYVKDVDTQALVPLDQGSITLIGARKQVYIGDDTQGDGNDSYTRFGPFRAWDSGTKTSATTGQKQSIIFAAIQPLAGFTILRKRITAAWLADTVGDVYTDATVTYTESNMDTYYGTSFNLAGDPDNTQIQYGGWGDEYQPHIMWDLTNAFSENEVSAVKISVMLLSAPPNDNVGNWQRITSLWNESSVTSTNAPTATATGQVAWPNPVTVGAGNRSEATITALYQAWVNGTNPNFGLKLDSTQTANQANGAFGSSENATSTNWPWLLLTLATIEQEGFRFRNDDGTETTATWKAAQDTQVTGGIVETPFRLRIILNATGTAPTQTRFQLEVRKKGTSDPWQVVN